MGYAKLAVQFLVYIAQIVYVQGYTKISQYIMTYEEGNSLKSILTRLLYIKLNEIYLHYTNAQ